MTNRFPRSVYEVGDEPDPRFSLANERTFLAWIRTALAFLAAGVAIEAFALPIHPVLRTVSAALFVLLGIGAAVQGLVGWMRAERAMRAGWALPAPSGVLFLAPGIVVAVAVLVAGFIW